MYAAPLWLPWPAIENRPTGHRTNTDNPAKWSHTCLLAERRSPGHATRTSLLGVTFNSRVQTMPFHWPVSYCFSEHTCRPSHTTKPRCAFVCTSRKISNTTNNCLTAARGQMRVEFMRIRGSRALPTCAASRNRRAAHPGSSCAAGFKAELSAHKACRTREPSAALSHCVRGYHQPVGCGCRRAPPVATDRQRCRGSSCATGFKCNNNRSHGYFRQCFAFITISWILVRYQYTRRYLRAALSQRYWMSTRCVLF